MGRIKYKHDITCDEIDSLFFEFIDKRKIYLNCGMNIQKASLIMDVALEKLNDYALNEYNVTFEKMMHIYRIDSAEELWDESPRISISKMAKSVGYVSVIEFLYRFISHNKCIPSVWKRRYGIV